MRILGIDPGFAITGYGIIDTNKSQVELVCYGVIRTSAKNTFPERITEVYESLNTIIEKYEPDEVAIEELFFNKNVKTGILVSQARGVMILSCVLNGIKINEYTPLQVKKGLTGYGKAPKVQCMSVVRMLLELEEIPKPDDAADALAVALCHYNESKFLSAIKES